MWAGYQAYSLRINLMFIRFMVFVCLGELAVWGKFEYY